MFEDIKYGMPQYGDFFDGEEVLPDKSYPTPSRSQLHDQDKRLKSGEIKTLYHQTDQSSADAILKSNKMLRGSSGLAGGGIYFATTPSHTNHKAMKKGVILECDVALGRTYTTSSDGDSSLSFRKLLFMDDIGFDSVVIPRINGHEYVVYNHKQILNVRIYQPRKKWFSW